MKYKATFSNGITLYRTSPREYAAAWALFANNAGPAPIKRGFARTRELADKAVAAELNFRKRYGWPDCRAEVVTAEVA
jgi:hypothetical protein